MTKTPAWDQEVAALNPSSGSIPPSPKLPLTASGWDGELSNGSRKVMFWQNCVEIPTVRSSRLGHATVAPGVFQPLNFPMREISNRSVKIFFKVLK